MKICSLLPSGTEILFALGLGDQITGVSDLCDYPPEACSKPVVSRSKMDVSVLSSDEVEKEINRILAAGESPYELDQEWLLAHPPDVVLTQDLCYFCEIDARTVGQAVQGLTHQPRVVVMQPKTLAGIFETIVEVGEVCEASGAATALVDALEKRVGKIQDETTPRNRKSGRVAQVQELGIRLMKPTKVRTPTIRVVGGCVGDFEGGCVGDFDGGCVGDFEGNIVGNDSHLDRSALAASPSLHCEHASEA